jgi:hypothetical protein
MISQEYVQITLHYDPATGVLCWRDAFGEPTLRLGDRDKRGRYRFKVKGKKYFSHRLIWLYVTGSLPKYEIDHIDGDVTNNRFENLREATRLQNAKNRKTSHQNTTGINGVSFKKNGWEAIINAGGQIYLGRFKTKAEAVAARLEAEKQYFGEFARAEIFR